MQYRIEELSGPELDLAVALSGERFKRLDRLFPTMTLDATFKDARVVKLSEGRKCLLTPSNEFRQDHAEFKPSAWFEHAGFVLEDLTAPLQLQSMPAEPLQRVKWLCTVVLGTVHVYMDGCSWMEAAMRGVVALERNAMTIDLPTEA